MKYNKGDVIPFVFKRVIIWIISILFLIIVISEK
jgi:hypothetical protein